MSNPLVSIIIPTTHERINFNESILNQMLLQDYKEKEILWDFETGTIGEKRNRLCAKANGEICLHADSDDFYGPQWISKSVEALQTSNADIVGLSELYFYDEILQQGWKYTWDVNGYKWVSGATLAYKRSYWENNKFPEIQIGEDASFTSRTQNIFAHGYIDGFLASIHDKNTSRREVETRNYRRCSLEEEVNIRKRFFGAEANATI